jgi:uncharacterized protein (DUF58 family)
MRYLDAVALAKLKNLSLELRRLSTEGHATGRHRGRFKGFSRDFAQHRPYSPGDELKSLDWKAYARQDRFYVREYQAENLLNATLLLDASGSMGFSHQGRPAKWETACRLAMALAYLVLARGDAAGLITFDVEPRQSVPPRGSLGHLEVFDALLGSLSPRGETDLGAVLEASAARIRRRSLVILISDLLGDAESILKVVKAFKARKHEVLVLQVLDPAERDFPYEGPVVFESLEESSELYCDATGLASLYREEFARRLRLYEATFHRCDISYAAFYTDRPWDEALGRLLGGRAP